ncbi:uncharacterized protein LOC129771308 isoform X2 [Toxorhynchites rutilus septentrionalis]|uniref:uncharacterized protein LOC129771308 isoform X2 n=1 Tax=Toxorhynchites rutilus septentrionalis TaxID=329112 RepID=UPI00247927B9|nr:uncharacterized protein LOC129771308 isoform X2 [Toxorhynchites rutilus septentrionalis]
MKQKPENRTSGKVEICSRAIVEEQLLRPLQALSLKLYYESDSSGSAGGVKDHPLYHPDRATIDESQCTAVVKRVAELVQRFSRRRFSNSAHDVAQQRNAWKHVLKFLFLLRAIGPGSVIYGTGMDSTAGQPRELPPEMRRYRLTVMDILVDYIRHKCSTLAAERNPVVLLAECNQIVSSLRVIFDGDSEFVTLTLLKTDLVAGSGAVALMYPVFEQVLTRPVCRASSSSDAPLEIIDYVRLLLCYKKWKAMVPARRDKDAINALAIKILPACCPGVKLKRDLPFVRMLPRFSAAIQDDETRFLLAKDLMEIEQLCAIYSREYEKRYRLQSDPKLSASEIRSNFTNIDALAEFIQRKCNLLRDISRLSLSSTSNPTPNAGQPTNKCHQQYQRQQLRHESNSIISSLRLIFRCDAEFISWTLLRVETRPECQAILGPVYEQFLASPPLSAPSVESYGRLLLCYIKWKQLYHGDDPGGHWDRIDRIALAALPYDFPRTVKQKELALKGLFPKVAMTEYRRTKKPTKDSVTRALLESRQLWDSIQDICLKFLAICREEQTNRVKAIPVAKTWNDDDVLIVKTESNSIIVLDSDDDELCLPDCTDSKIIRSNSMVVNNGRGKPISGTLQQIDLSSINTYCYLSPPIPEEEKSELKQELSAGVRKVRVRKKLSTQGVRFKISKNLRLRANRERREFLIAFKKLCSDERLRSHVQLCTKQDDYCLLKTMFNSTIFIEVICLGDIHPNATIFLTVDRNDLVMFNNRSFTRSPSIKLEEPILQQSSNEQDTDKQRILDNKLLDLITDLDDIPALWPASLDFAVFPEVQNQDSFDILTNYQTPPSAVVDSYSLWQSDIFPIFANLDYNPWLDNEIVSLPKLI